MSFAKIAEARAVKKMFSHTETIASTRLRMIDNEDAWHKEMRR